MGLAILMAAASLDAQQPAAPAAANDPIRTLVSRLDLEKYKATIKGLTAFGDRRQGTSATARPSTGSKRSSRATAAPTERVSYEYKTPATARDAAVARAAGRNRPTRSLPAAKCDPDRAARAIAGSRGEPASTTIPTPSPTKSCASSNREPTTDGAREQVYCTKVGTTRPDEMYIVGAHMDGHGWGEAANDNGSGTALVMELARIFSMPDVADRAHDPLRAVEQRRDRTERRARLRRTARRAAGQGGSARIGTLSRNRSGSA